MGPEVLDSYGRVKIVRDRSDEMLKYLVITPSLTEEEGKIIKDPENIIPDFKGVMKQVGELKTSSEKEEFIHAHVKDLLSDKNVSEEKLDYLTSIILDEVFLGYGLIGELMRDDRLEEVMINGVHIPIFVVHRKYGMCKTNLSYETQGKLDDLIKWMTSYTGRQISEKKPLLDAHLPDGSRANVTVPPASPHGPAVTIRKFKRVPYNIIDLIKLGTMSTELAAFLWVCIEGFGLKPCDILIAGGAGSGKTTLMNALSMFIPKTDRIVTVEDTLELNFGFMDNWVSLEATPHATGDAGEISMHSLVKNSLRMRPDRVIVGEVRGIEAETLLVAMDIGLDGSMGTIHANNARETTIRLMDPPMNVPIRMIPLIDLIIVMNRIYDRTKGMVRRITQVAEVSGVEKDVVQLGDIYTWDLESDQITRTMYPIMLKEKIAKGAGITKKRVNTEIYIRERILKYMVEKDIKDNQKVISLLQQYHTSPKEVISQIKENANLTAGE